MKGWGGRASDKNITEKCGLLSKLLPGDVVLADRGFDISESVGLVCAEVEIPAFTQGRSQLSPLEVESTRKNNICSYACGESDWPGTKYMHNLTGYTTY